MVAHNEHTLEKPVQWVAVSQQFFNTTLIAKNGFSSGEIHLAKETADTSDVVERAQVNLQAKIPALASTVLPMLLLTLFIRLITSPLVYSSYLSGAKMKALRPEIEAMKKRVGGDQQQVGMEQMKLFREAGVNPLGGCIPALLQIPIFFALYSFFNSNIALRGQPFLWSHDLSSYDSIVNFGFSIPAYGDHI